MASNIFISPFIAFGKFSPTAFMILKSILEGWLARVSIQLIAKDDGTQSYLSTIFKISSLESLIHSFFA
jgi:hypothetical protein